MLKVLHEQNAAEATANRAERDSLRGDVGTHRDRIEQVCVRTCAEKACTTGHRLRP